MNRGWLKNGNPGGDLTKAARCEAKTRRGGRASAPRWKTGVAGFMVGRAPDQKRRRESSASDEP